MKTSEQLNEIAAALAKAQSKMTHAGKDAVNPHFKSKYATLASVVDSVREHLASNGIAFVQLPQEIESGVAVETVLMHSSGQWISSVTPVPVSKLDAQGVGSALTYARRYGLSSMCGIAPDDDDGNAAVDAAPKRRTGARDAVLKETGTPNASDIVDYFDPMMEAIINDDKAGLTQLAHEIATRVKNGELHENTLTGIFDQMTPPKRAKAKFLLGMPQ